MTSGIELKAHYMKYIDNFLHPPLVIYCDASTDRHGTAGDGVLILDIDLEESAYLQLDKRS